MPLPWNFINGRTCSLINKATFKYNLLSWPGDNVIQARYQSVLDEYVRCIGPFHIIPLNTSLHYVIFSAHNKQCIWLSWLDHVLCFFVITSCLGSGYFLWYFLWYFSFPTVYLQCVGLLHALTCSSTSYSLNLL